MFVQLVLSMGAMIGERLALTITTMAASLYNCGIAPKKV